MGILWGVYVKAHLLDVVGEIGPGEGQVLKGAGEASVGRRFDKKTFYVFIYCSIHLDECF